MDNQDNQDEIIEAYVVEATEAAPEANQATVLLSLEELIKRHITSIDKISLELRQQREMFEDSFANNPTFREHAEKAKEANKVKAGTRNQISNQPSVISVATKIKTLRGELKERQVALSDYLLEYQRMTGATEIEDENNQLRTIVNTAKLVKQASSSK